MKMKNLYVSPEIEIVRYTFRDVILTSPTEGSIPEQGGEFDPDNPGSELPEL